MVLAGAAASWYFRTEEMQKEPIVKPLRKSFKRAFFLILRNIARIGAVALLSTIFLFLGKMFICAIPTTAAVYLLIMNESTKVASPAVPLAIIAISTYIIGSSMMAVYGMTIDTMLVCFVGDEEANKEAHGGPFYASGELSSFVSAKAKECKENGVKSGYDNGADKAEGPPAESS